MNKYPKIYKCKICGHTWDEDGDHVSVVSGVAHKVVYFICEECKEEKKNTRQED